MTERREIKQRSQAVWDRVKEAYLAGEPASSVARRFDVGVANLRYRAREQGWTRRDHIETQDAADAEETARREGRWTPPGPAAASAAPPPPTRVQTTPAMDVAQPWDQKVERPSDAIRLALTRAGRLLAAGRVREAEDLIKGAQALAEVGGGKAPSLADMEADEDDTLSMIDTYAMALKLHTMMMVEALFQPDPLPPRGFELWFLHWRARRDPARHDADRDHLIAAGRDDLMSLYRDGRLIPETREGPAVIEQAIEHMLFLRSMIAAGSAQAAIDQVQDVLLETGRKAVR